MVFALSFTLNKSTNLYNICGHILHSYVSNISYTWYMFFTYNYTHYILYTEWQFTWIAWWKFGGSVPDWGKISNSVLPIRSLGSPDPGTWRAKVIGISEVLVSTTSLIVSNPTHMKLPVLSLCNQLLTMYLLGGLYVVLMAYWFITPQLHILCMRLYSS